MSELNFGKFNVDFLVKMNLAMIEIAKDEDMMTILGVLPVTCKSILAAASKEMGIDEIKLLDLFIEDLKYYFKIVEQKND